MFHSNNPTLFGRPGSVVAGATALRSTIVRLRGLSRSLTSEAPQAPTGVHELLSRFADQLSGYFDPEETSDHHGTIGEGRPDLGGKLEGLEHGHSELRDSVAALGRFAHEEGEAGELGRRIDHVVDDFEQQEHGENELLQEFFLRDEGGAG